MTRESTRAEQQAVLEFKVSLTQEVAEDARASARVESVGSQIGLFFTQRCYGCKHYNEGSFVGCVLTSHVNCGLAGLRVTHAYDNGMVDIEPLRQPRLKEGRN